MSVEQERRLLSRPANSRHDARSPGLRLVERRLDPDLAKIIGQALGGRALVAVGTRLEASIDGRETDQVTERAGAKLVAKGVDLMVANDVSAPGVGFDHDTNEVTIFGADGSATRVGLRSKAAVADAVLDRVSALLPPR